MQYLLPPKKSIRAPGTCLTGRISSAASCFASACWDEAPDVANSTDFASGPTSGFLAYLTVRRRVWEKSSALVYGPAAVAQGQLK